MNPKIHGPRTNLLTVSRRRVQGELVREVENRVCVSLPKGEVCNEAGACELLHTGVTFRERSRSPHVGSIWTQVLHTPSILRKSHKARDARQLLERQSFSNSSHALSLVICRNARYIVCMCSNRTFLGRTCQNRRICSRGVLPFSRVSCIARMTR